MKYPANKYPFISTNILFDICLIIVFNYLFDSNRNKYYYEQYVFLVNKNTIISLFLNSLGDLG